MYGVVCSGSGCSNGGTLLLRGSHNNHNNHKQDTTSKERMKRNDETE